MHVDISKCLRVILLEFLFKLNCEGKNLYYICTHFGLISRVFQLSSARTTFLQESWRWSWRIKMAPSMMQSILEAERVLAVDGEVSPWSMGWMKGMLWCLNWASLQDSRLYQTLHFFDHSLAWNISFLLSYWKLYWLLLLTWIQMLRYFVWLNVSCSRYS